MTPDPCGPSFITLIRQVSYVTKAQRRRHSVAENITNLSSVARKTVEVMNDFLKRLSTTCITN